MRFRSLTLASALAVSALAPMQCAPTTPPRDTVNNTTFQTIGTNGIKGYPDRQYFIDAGGPLLHEYLLCNYGGTLRYERSPEFHAAQIPVGSIVLYCKPGGKRSTDWGITGRPS